jgi:outer membrane usher protein FimD/PapC
LPALIPADCLAAKNARTADQVSDRINQTGRALSITVALLVDGRPLGDVLVRLDGDDNVHVARASLLDALKSDGAPDMLEKLKRIEADYISLERLREAGLDIGFDKQNISLVLGLRTDQRKSGDISLAPAASARGANIAKPGTVSGFVNFITEVDYLWEPQQTALQFDVEAAMRLGGIVFETEFSLQNSINGQLCPVGALCLFDHDGGFKRRGARAVYDAGEWQSRFTLGDTHTQATTFQRAPDIGGVSVEYAPERFDPTSPIRATGSQSFVIERPATVDVLINGGVVQHLHLVFRV